MASNQYAASSGDAAPMRFALLDAMRGVAVLAVAVYHFHGLLTVEAKHSMFGPVLDWICHHGDLGVEVFFVLSGFVLAHVLRPLRISPSVVGRFVLRRSVRLDPTYWVVLFATFAVNAYLVHRGVIQRPPVSPGVVLANMCYMQEILSVYSPVNVAWTLCAEVQFYLFFILSLWAFQWLRKSIPRQLARLIVFGPPAVASLLIAGEYLPSMRGIYLGHWHYFFLGVMSYWSLIGLMSSIWFWAYTGFMLLFCNGAILGAIASALTIQGLARLGLLQSTTRGRLLQFIGSRSYSIYLVHVLVGSNLIRLLLRLNWVPETFLVLVVFFVLALVASLLAAEILYRLVERPSHRLARTIAWESPAATAARAGPGEATIPRTEPRVAVPADGGLLAAVLGRRWPTVSEALRAEIAWLVPVGVFGLIWLTELYIIQELTLDPGHDGGRLFNFVAPKVRFLMDVCFVGACMSVLGRGGLALAAIGSSTLNLILLTYFNYFNRPLSLLHTIQSFHESMEMSAFAWDLLDGATILSLGAVLVLKLLVVKSIPAAPRWRSPAWLGFFGAFVMGYVVLFIVADYKDPLDRIAYKRTLGRLGIYRGYLGPWLAEFYYLNDDRLLQRALERREFKSDQLTPVEIPVKIEPRLVIIQVETLDTNVLGYRVDGREVTPFLNRLRDSAMYFRVKAFRFQGSYDSDFTMTAGVAATARVNAYNLPNYPFDDALPHVLRKHGYHAIALHGYPSSFYNRGPAFYKMGFEKALFQDELEHDFNLPLSTFGIRDEDVLRLSSQMLRDSKEPVCHFIITLTSHTPYKFVIPNDDYPFPRPANIAERYFNSMRYVDDCLREYVMSLPKGTTVVIYGDHTTEVQATGFAPDRDVNTEYIPVFIYDVDHNLADEQRTRNDPLATNGELNLLDITTYLRNRIIATDTLSLGDGKPAEGESQPLPSEPAAAQPPQSQDKPSVRLNSPPDGEPFARQQGSISTIEAPDDP